jgi:hypothetical protein
MATCKDCIHEKVCVIKAFPDAFENTQWDKAPCDHFKSTADVVPKKEIANVLGDLKIAVHNKAMNSYAKEVPSYVHIKVFDAIIQDYLNKLEKR